MRLARLLSCLVAVFAVLTLSESMVMAAQGTDAGAAAEEPAATGLSVIDWAIVVAYGLSTLALGWYYGRKQKDTSEYFIGSGHMNPLLIGVSLFATLLSTISYLSMPGEMLGKGPVTLVGIATFPVLFVIVGYFVLPFYMKQRATSAYELLELKLGVKIRVLGAAMFVALRLGWMALLVFLTAEALTVMLNLDRSAIPWFALVTGLIAVTYSSIGGLRAVVITDLMQTLLLYGGALLVLLIVTLDFGGLGWIPTTWQGNWDPQPILPINPDTGEFDLKVRATVVGSILSTLVWYLCTSAGDQTSVQRFMATSDAKAARRALITQLVVSVVVSVTLAFVGLALLSYYQAHPNDIRDGLTLKSNADKMFPAFIVDQLPRGVAGLVVSAMFAAAMSSIDSGVNSISAVVTTDFLDRFGYAPKTERGHMLVAKLLAFSIGVIVVVGSSFMEQVTGNITAVTQKTSNLLTTPIFCLFFFAMFVPFARPAGVIAGAIFGTLTAAIIAFSGPLVVVLSHSGIDPQVFNTTITRLTDPKTGVISEVAEDPISFQWIGPLSLVVNIVVGCSVSYVLSRRARDE